MRAVLFALPLSACVVGNELADRPSSPVVAEPGLTAARVGMEPLASTPNLGHGVVPGVGRAAAWVGMGDRICNIEGEDGAVTLDVWLDGEPVPGLILLDVVGDTWLADTPVGVVVTGPSGDVVSVAYVAGRIVGGALTDGGAALVASRGGACEVVTTDFVGASVRHPVHDGACAPGADHVFSAGGLLIGGGEEILLVRADGPVPLAPGDQVALDASSGALFAGARGGREVQVALEDGASYDLALPGDLVDFAAGDGRLVALVEPGVLVRFDATTGMELDRAPYQGPLGVERMELTDSGAGLVLTTPTTLQFYRLGRPAPVGAR